MKINCGRTEGQRRADWHTHEGRAMYDYYATWRKKFAWLPVRVGEYDCRWLEFVETRVILLIDFSTASKTPYFEHPYRAARTEHRAIK